MITIKQKYFKVFKKSFCFCNCILNWKKIILPPCIIRLMMMVGHDGHDVLNVCSDK